MTRPAAPLLLAALGLALAACAERPFVDAFPAELAAMPPDAIQFDVCYPDGADLAEIRRLAEEVCRDRQRAAQPLYSNRFQCRLTAPHLTRYACR